METFNEGFDQPHAEPAEDAMVALHTRLYLLWNAIAVPDTRVWVGYGRVSVRPTIDSRGEYSYVYISGTPFSSFLIGAWLKRRPDVRVVIDYRDPWTQSITFTSVGVHALVHRRVEAWIVVRSDGVISNTRHNDTQMFKNLGAARPREKFVAIHNGYDCGRLRVDCARTQPEVHGDLRGRVLLQCGLGFGARAVRAGP